MSLRNPSPVTVVGVDACKAGWCAVTIRQAGNLYRVAESAIYSSFKQLLARDVDLICIDIPIGLLDQPGQRSCDTAARQMLGGPRRSSVFPPPCRSAIRFVADYVAASQTNLQVTGKKLTKQSFGIMPKIADVDQHMTPDRQSHIKEVHPEVCFWALNNRRPMSWNKIMPEGSRERWRTLMGILPFLSPEPKLPPEIGKGCALDDFIDALAAAWTAICIVHGSGTRIPQEPKVDQKGLRMEMWLPPV